MKKKIFAIHKPIGISPLEAIRVFKSQNPDQLERKMTYAGRLDPMAEGVLLIVADEELKNFKKHLLHSKEYLAEILFSITTDSYDLLGIPTKKRDPDIEKIKKEINSFDYNSELLIPPFSSYRIKGKPLFKWALENKLDQIEIPKKRVKIKLLEADNPEKINSKELKEIIFRKLKQVKGDFRQEEIIKKWEELGIEQKEEYITIKLRIVSETGFYVRGLANEIGQRVGSGAVLMSLKRTRVGDYDLKKTIKI